MHLYHVSRSLLQMRGVIYILIFVVHYTAKVFLPSTIDCITKSTGFRVCKSINLGIDVSYILFSPFDDRRLDFSVIRFFWSIKPRSVSYFFFLFEYHKKWNWYDTYRIFFDAFIETFESNENQHQFFTPSFKHSHTGFDYITSPFTE